MKATCWSAPRTLRLRRLQVGVLEQTDGGNHAGQGRGRHTMNSKRITLIGTLAVLLPVVAASGQPYEVGAMLVCQAEYADETWVSEGQSDSAFEMGGGRRPSHAEPTQPSFAKRARTIIGTLGARTPLLPAGPRMPGVLPVRARQGSLGPIQ